MLRRKDWNKRLTDEVILETAERSMTSLDSPGLCLLCGNEQDGCEPDAENYVCESCGAEQVFGAEQLILAIA